MNESSATKPYIIWGVIGLIVLASIGLMAYLFGQIFGGSAAAPTATPASLPVVTISGLRSQAKLSSVEMKAVTEVYKENVPDGWLDNTLGRKEKLLMLVYGNVQAGFDLEKMAQGNLWTDGKKVRLVLPAPQILNSSIDFTHTHVVYYENSLLFDTNNPNLQGAALAEAQQAIEQAALEGGVLNEANKYGKLYFENLLYSLGFTQVEVVVDAQIFKE